MKLALIDLDGTLADYDKALRGGLMMIAGDQDPPLPENLHKGPEWLARRANLIKRQEGFWRDLEPIPLGFCVVDLLHELGYGLHVLTKGPTHTTSAWTEKRDWCHQYLPSVPVTVTEDKGLTYGKVLFDDFPPYIEMWLKHRPRGKVIMLAHTWNRDFKHPQVFRIENKDQLKDIKGFLLG